MDSNVKVTGSLNELVISLIALATAATDYLVACAKEKVVDLRKEELPEVQQLRKEVLLLTLRQTRGDLQRRAAQRAERPPRQAQAKPEAAKAHQVKPAMQAGSQAVQAAKEAAKAKREAPLTAKPLAEALKNVVPVVAAAPVEAPKAEVREPTLEELELLTRPTAAPAAAPAS